MNPVLNLTIDEPPDASGASMCRIVAAAGGSTATVNVPILPAQFHGSLRLLQAELLRGGPSRRATAAVEADDAGARKPVMLQRRPPAGPAAPSANAPDMPAPQGANVPRQKEPIGANLTSGAAERMLEEIGSQLFKFLFSEIKDLLKAGRAESTKLGKPLLIRLCVKHPGLASIPWEALYDPDTRTYVTTSSFTPLTRSVDLDDSQILSPMKPPLRILAMASRVRSMANGTQMAAIGSDQELGGIREALAKLTKKGAVRLGHVVSAQPRHLDLAVRRGDIDDDDDSDGEVEHAERWNIFHFIGHGGYDENRRMGYIIVQERGGAMGAKLFSSALQQFLVQPDRTPSLVVLNSCSGAAEHSGKLFSSIAAELVQAGIPAVVAMQFEISDEMAIVFANHFYTYLSEGGSIQDALTRTRRILQAQGFSEWIAPVLYMQSSDGLFFKNVTAPPTAPSQQP